MKDSSSKMISRTGYHDKNDRVAANSMMTTNVEGGEKTFGTTVHSAIMSEIRLDSHLTKVLMQNIDRIQHKRAKQLAKNIELR